MSRQVHSPIDTSVQYEEQLSLHDPHLPFLHSITTKTLSTIRSSSDQLISYTNTLLFTRSSHGCTTLSGKFLVLELGVDNVVACSHVRLLGVDITSVLSVPSCFRLTVLHKSETWPVKKK